VKLFLFVGHHNFMFFVVRAIEQIEDPNKIFILFCYNIAYNFSSSVHKHVHRRQATKFRAHEIKYFHNHSFRFSYLANNPARNK